MRPQRHVFEGGGHRYGMTLVLTLALAIYGLLAPDSSTSRAVEIIAAGVILLVTVLTSGAPRRTRWASNTAMAVIVIALFITDRTGVTDPAVALSVVAVLLLCTAGVIAAGVVRLIVDRGVNLEAVLGAISVYVLVGLTFSFIIGALALGRSQPFFVGGTDATQNTRIYYSFTVLTTTGFGDYTAATRGGRALAVLEMLIGQLYLVTVIAMLVGNLRHGRDRT